MYVIAANMNGPAGKWIATAKAIEIEKTINLRKLNFSVSKYKLINDTDRSGGINEGFQTNLF